MRQKLAIAQAVMERPAYIFLDEPTNGLDEDSVGLLHKIILEEKERGAVIVIASHSREDIETLCDITFTMKNGKIEKLDNNDKGSYYFSFSFIYQSNQVISGFYHLDIFLLEYL